jgi:GDPmannose 4,6-dehydratase
LQGDARKAAAKLGWRHKTKFNDLVTEMVDADIQLVDREKWRRDRSAR